MKSKLMSKIPVFRKVQQVRTLSALWRFRGPLSRMLRDMVRGTYKASFLTMAALVIGVLYLISPIDLIPDFLIGIGWIDDGFVMYFLVKRLLHELQRYQGAQPGLKLVRRS